MQDTKKPCQLSFYIVSDTVYLNSTDGGVPHPDLWQKVVMRAFNGLAFDNKLELINNCYGVDRGRVVYIESESMWVLYGTPGCSSKLDQLLELFSLIGLNHRVDFRTDIHYRTRPTDVAAVDHALKLIDCQIPNPPILMVKEIVIK